MASSCFTLLLFVALALGVKAADKELGQGCTSGTDQCVHPSLGLVCDVVAKKCMIKHGQSCAGTGHSDLCVAGAECTSGTCTCKSDSSAPYAEDANTGKCTVTGNKWGSTCSDSSACADSTFTCTDAVCVCAADKKVDLATGLCSDAVAASKVGKACDTAGEDATNCGTRTSTHLECPSGGGTCFCQTGYIGTIGEDCSAVSGTKVGLPCTSSGSECGTQQTTHLTCPSSNCACETDYYGVPGGDCYVTAGQIGGGCSGTSGQQGSCSSNVAVCMTTGQGMTCLIQVNQSCTGNTDKCVTGATCDTTSGNTCKCGDGYQEVAATKTCGEKDQDSGAVSVAASAVTVVLSAFFCPLFLLP